jgi:hypothetical protein
MTANSRDQESNRISHRKTLEKLHDKILGGQSVQLTWVASQLTRTHWSNFVREDPRAQGSLDLH